MIQKILHSGFMVRIWRGSAGKSESGTVCSVADHGTGAMVLFSGGVDAGDGMFDGIQLSREKDCV